MSRLARLYRSQSRVVPEQGLSHRFVSRREGRSEIHREPYRSHSPSDLRLITLVGNLSRAVRALAREARPDGLEGEPAPAGELARRRGGVEEDWLTRCLLDEIEQEEDDERWRSKRRSRPARTEAARAAVEPEPRQPAARAEPARGLGRLLAWPLPGR